MTALLAADDVVKRFGGVRALDGAALHVEEGTVHGLIGPNGSGKTTLLGVLSGTHRADSGTVVLDGRPLPTRSPHATVRAGVSRTFQTTRLFGTWSLRDTVALAGEEGRREDASGTRRSVDDVLAAVGLADRADAPCGSLTNSEQRIAMVALAQATNPRVILLDEPAVGMSADETNRLDRAIRSIQDSFGTAVVVVEHNMHFLMSLADTVTVMNAGKVLAVGTPAEIRANAEVIASYLGA